MSLIIIVLAIFFVLMLYSPSVKKVNRSQELEDLKYKVHEYSGLHPSSYLSFENNLELMETELEKLNSPMAEYYLEKAVENIEDLSLYTTGSNTEIIDDLMIISKQIGMEAEKLIMEVALFKKNQFRPKYLNNLNDTTKYYPGRSFTQYT
jgi:hypothetical protein